MDEAIYLGDYHDCWADTAEQNGDAASWVKAKLADPRNEMGLGNHDISYAFPLNYHASCSGFSHDKCRAIRSFLTQADFEKLKPCTVAHGILFTHAGVSRDLLELLAARGYDVPVNLTADSIAAFINHIWPSVLRDYSAGKGHPLLAAGYNRGGDQRVGGIIWEDFGSHEPIEGVKQIIGHSTCKQGPLFRFPSNGDGSYDLRLAHSKEPAGDRFAGGWTLDIDTHSKHYVVIEDNTLRVKSVNWERHKGDDVFTVTPGETICELKLL